MDKNQKIIAGELDKITRQEKDCTSIGKNGVFDHEEKNMVRL